MVFSFIVCSLENERMLKAPTIDYQLAFSTPTNHGLDFVFAKFFLFFALITVNYLVFRNRITISEVEDMVTGLMQKISGKWTCMTCNSECRDKTDLRRHIEAKHINAEVICPVCFNHYKTRESFAKHMVKMHAGVAFV